MYYIYIYMYIMFYVYMYHIYIYIYIYICMCMYPVSNAIAKHKLYFQKTSKHPSFIIDIDTEIKVAVIK